ncbi:hypothetical protein [Actinomycetospora sp. TBRC 11914]|uniref:hypothetical protein n=1 Tax=Actinomycetospora sp. TBRC 11914 TaxID=2729387 RepID=UPI00145DE9DB|nr:hypothetical protein [Actinomycetospora sp. TBRC 11914]NMO89797.1 hypothetical protein [Actinomycetospora sp. TBRC 11914]
MDASAAPEPTTPDRPEGGWIVDVPLIGPVGWPPTGSLVFLVAVGGLAATGLVPWPVAGLLGLGHVLARDRDHRVIGELGAALEEA